QFADRYLESKQHLWRAVDAVREHSSTRNIGYVTSRLLEFAEEVEVAELIIATNWSDPNVIRQSPSLAQHLWLAGRYNEALRFLDAMADRAPTHPLLSYTRANVLRYLGDMNGAESEYEACISASPELPDAHWSLSTHSKAQPPLARVDRIQRALSKHPAGSLEQAHLFYALFREFDAAQLQDEAWSALSQGAAIMRARVAFDAERQAARLRLWTQGKQATADVPIADGPTPVFIVGLPRTGTTLLDRMLSNHVSVVSLGERNDFAAAISEVGDHFFNSLTAADYGDWLWDLDFARAGHLYRQRLRLAEFESGHFIDKNPQNLFNLPLILRALPGARIICLKRDAMDACFSNLKELFQGNAYPYSYSLDDLADHYQQASSWMDHWQRTVPGAVLTVDYEELVTDPERVLTEVQAFLNLDVQHGLHEITSNLTPVATASSSQVREAVNQRGVGAWKKYDKQLITLASKLGR
ncbi:MAG: tetratricopeptide repeat-containing sulfotransferase family protein, partial [Povalibacter sp.]